MKQKHINMDISTYTEFENLRIELSEQRKLILKKTELLRELIILGKKELLE